MQNVPWNVANNRCVVSFFLQKKLEKTKTKLNQTKCTSIGVKLEWALIATNVYEAVSG